MSFTSKQGENLRRLRNSPLLIICGRPGEAEEIARHLGIYANRLSSHEVAEIHNDHTFYYGQFELNDGYNLEYVVTSSTRQGVQSFTVQAALLMHILRPKFVLHAGVCAGRNDGEIQLGDVVFGESALNFEEGKFEVKDGQVVFLPSYHQVNIRVGDMQAFADDNIRPGIHYGDYITGSAVRKDAHIIFDRISTQVGRDVKALDMEASAFLELCVYFLRESRCLGVIKGVSDHGDGKKDARNKQRALAKTAEAIQEWVVHSIPVKSWEDDYTHEPAAEIVPVYYDNFIKRVMDNVSQELPVTKKHTLGQVEEVVHIDVKSIKGLKVILPKNGNPIEYKEHGAISNICNTHGIMEVETGGALGKRSLYYKNGYLIDWPRILNKYSDSYDAKHQVVVFSELLKKKAWFHGTGDALRASVVDWQDFTSWLEEGRTPPPSEGGQTPPATPMISTVIYAEPERKESISVVTSVERSPSPSDRFGTKLARGRPTFVPKPEWLRKDSMKPVVVTREIKS